MKNLCWILLLIANMATAQVGLKGRVISADTKKPIALANVFLSNTSVGTITNDKGDFLLERFPAGRYDVVISCIGYETYITTLQSTQLPESLNIELKEKVNELQEVIVEPYEKNGWEKYGSFFIENFMGTSAWANNCKLKNPETVKFRFSKKENTLRAYADEPLIVENDALGYNLRYDLISFSYNYTTRIFYYQGYPLFEEMTTSRKRQENRWKENRALTYYGSLMHFMRALFRNRLVENGFEIRRLTKVSEAEQKRVKALQSRVRSVSNGSVMIIATDNAMGGGSPDSAAYYRKVMNHPEELNVFGKDLLTGDSIAYAIDSVTAGFNFPDYLYVVYKYKKNPKEYDNLLQPQKRYTNVTSELNLPNGKPLIVLGNGSFFEGIDMVASGYWGWWEKLATMLPYDYVPPPRK